MLAIPSGSHSFGGFVEEFVEIQSFFNAVFAHAYQGVVCTEANVVVARHQRHGDIETADRMSLKRLAVGGFVEVCVIAVVVYIQFRPGVVDECYVGEARSVSALIEHHPSAVEHLAYGHGDAEELAYSVVAVGDHELHIIVAARAGDYGFQHTFVADGVNHSVCS